MTHTDRTGNRAERSSTAMLRSAAASLLAFALMAAACGGATEEPPDATGSPPGSKPPSSQPSTTPHLPVGGVLEAGTYVASAIDPDFDASHRITISVPEGYQAFEGWGIMQAGGRQWVSASVVGQAYADPCHWRGTLHDPPVGRDLHALVAALANQRGLHATTPTDVMLAGFAGKQIELIVPAGINLADCDNGQFRFWLDTGGGERYTPFTGEHDKLWILDVDGVPLVIEAAWPLGASAQVQAELIHMVESVRIDPR